MSSATIDDDLLMATEPADEQVPSEVDLATIGDLTIWHQMPFLSARRLIQLNCNIWSVWESNNMKRIAEARRQDDTRDWYFPITITNWERCSSTLPPDASWAWSGIWHSTAHEATERVRPLPPMTGMRLDWRYASFPICEVIASAGGLLLIKSRSEIKLQLRRSARLMNKSGASSSSSSAPNLPLGTISGRSDKLQPLGWTRLMVCNPMTRECKELPAANCAEMGWQSWALVYRYPVQVHMEVNDEANWYQVVLILQNFVAVYKSTTNSWISMQFQESRPWCPHYYVWAYNGAIARLGGRLYVADVLSDHRANANANARLAQLPLPPTLDATSAGALRLFDVDTEAGRWKLLHEFNLRKFHLSVLHPDPEIRRFDMTILQHVELVGCMGELYAVIPARLQDVLTVGQKQSKDWKLEVHSISARRLDDDFEMREKGEPHMPLVFYLMQLQRDGVGVDHAVLRIPVLKSNKRPESYYFDYYGHKRRMYSWTNPNTTWGINWFWCEARGSVIWVSYEDYLLSYDVVSRKSTMRFIHLDGNIENMSHYSYRPSFHMKP